MIKLNGLFAIGYFLGGYLGTLISIPPSHASPIWPAAGIALAGLVAYGRWLIPGIWLGAFLTQAFAFLDPSSTDTVFFSLLIGTVASTAATAQATLGAWLIKRYVGSDNPLIDVGSILRFMALGGPVSCVMSASAGILTLTLKGIIELDSVPASWLTWWIGDTIGVLIFTPVLLCFIGQTRNHLWRTRIHAVALPLTLLALLVLVILHFGKQHEQTRLRHLFDERSHLLQQALQHAFSNYIEINEHLKAFFDNSNSVTASEFELYAKALLTHHPKIQALVWIARRPDTSNGADAYPITYIVPFQGNEAALGLDIAHKPICYETLQKARDRNQSAVSGLVQFVQYPDKWPSIVLYSPVYRPDQPLQTLEQRRQGFRGVVATVVQVKNKINAVKQEFAPSQVRITITDADTTLYQDALPDSQLASGFQQFQQTLSLPVADRTWQITYTATPAFYHDQLSWNIWWLILGGFALTGLTGVGLLLLTGRTIYTESVVKIRTEELQQEIHDRITAEASAQRISQLYALLSHCNQAIVRCTHRDQLFQQICRDSVHIGGMQLAWIGLIDSDKQRVRSIASAGAGVSYLHNLESASESDYPSIQGPCRTAIRENRAVWCQDFLNDPTTLPWHERGTRFNWRASAALPIQSEGKTVGLFNLYADKMNAFDEAVRELLMEMALDIGFALDNFDREIKRQRAEEALQKSEQYLRTIIETEPECVKIVDRHGRLIEMNKAGLTMLEVDSLETVKQHNLLDFILPPYRDAFIALHHQVLGGAIGSLVFEIVGLNGTRRWLDTYAAPLPDKTNGSVMMLAVTRDITDRKRAELQLKLAAKVFEQSSEGFMITDAQRNIIKVNTAFTVITGYSETEVLGQNAALLDAAQQSLELRQGILAAIDTYQFWQGEISKQRKNGEVFPALLNISVIRDNAGQISEYVDVFADITSIKASEAQLDYLAHHDHLTGLPNRLQLFFRLEHALGAAKREGKQLALLMLDLDRFKDVNDSLGHLAGDHLLQLVARRLKTRLRESDMVCRLGGDEFTVLLDEISQPEDAARIAQSLIADLSEPWHLPSNQEVLIGASIGISLYPDHGDTPQQLLQHADAAMYKAKESGRNSFAYFSNEFTIAARERIDLEGRLRRAIVNDELRVYYQAQIDIASGAIIGAEALVRWQCPIDGLVPPYRFIPVAEQTGLISALGAWVLKETCRQGRQWLEAGLKPLTLAVNVSPHQLRQGDLNIQVADVLKETRFPAGHLELELTESGLMERQIEIITLLNALRAQGIRLAIDDFGTGYSSLAYLKRFPLDVLKIDKSFIDDIPHQQDDMEIAATIIAMGHTLGFKVLAEGVETQDQLSFLQEKGCDYYQGYFKSKPLPADDFAKLLRGN